MFSRSLYLLRALPAQRRLLNKACQAGYKSQYNIKELYPNSAGYELKTSKSQPDSTDTFSGHIPLDDLQIKYMRSSGPGGQNVNKVNTKVEIRFHLGSAEWIPEDVKPKVAENERTRINKDGYLIVTSDKTSKQMYNQADCLYKIRDMVWKASAKEYEPTEEELAVMEKRKDKARKGILREKRERSLKKRSRQGPSIHSL